jgi:hypothetical protein
MVRVFHALFLLLFFAGCEENAFGIDNEYELVDIYKPENGVSWHMDLSDNPALNSSDIYFMNFYSENIIKNIKKLEDNKKFCQIPAGVYSAELERLFEIGDDLYPEIHVGKRVSADLSFFWVNIRADEIKELLINRIDYASQVGCDGINFTYVNLHNYDTGFGIGFYEQIDFNTFLSREAHKRGLSVSFQDVDSQIGELLTSAEILISQECFVKNNCSRYETFTLKDKPVFNIEFTDSISVEQHQEVCLISRAYDIKTVVMDRLSGVITYNLSNCKLEEE